MLIYSCAPKLAVVKLNQSQVRGITQGFVSIFSVILKAFICFVAVTLIGLFGSSTDIDCDCQHLRFFLQKGQVLQVFLYLTFY